MEDGDLKVEYTGPFARVPRPMTADSIRSLALAGGLLFMLGALTIVPLIANWTELADDNEAGLAILCAATMLGSLPLLLAGKASAKTLSWAFPLVVSVGFVLATVNISFALILVGPTFAGASLFFPQVILLAFIALRRAWAIAVTLLCLVGFVLAQWALDGPVTPIQHFFNVLATAVAVGVLIGGIANRLDDAQTALADINRRLRQFLAPQVADAVAASGESLRPHRRDIAVLFVDLRDFTTFTNSVSPDRVVDVLAAYYDAVGSVMDQCGATIGGFDGDGVFCFLGDPEPNENAATEVVVMAQLIAERLDTLTVEWSRDASPLGYGIGLAFGEATIGLVGYEGRFDYTPIGACVNLAARLCADAKHREIVIDDALRKAAKVIRPRRRGDVDLKGFGEVATYGVRH